MRGANWRDATVRSNHDYLDRYIYPVFGCVALNDITKFSVQMLLNKMANEGYSYWVVYHVRDLIKAGLAEAVDQDVLEKNVSLLYTSYAADDLLCVNTVAPHIITQETNF